MININIPDQIKSCAESCLECQEVCLRAATMRCIELGGGKHELLSLLYRCAQICQTAADFLSRDSMRHSTICRVCAETCDTCARECELVGDMKECVEACQACAASCREMIE